MLTYKLRVFLCSLLLCLGSLRGSSAPKKETRVQKKIAKLSNGIAIPNAAYAILRPNASDPAIFITKTVKADLPNFKVVGDESSTSVLFFFNDNGELLDTIRGHADELSSHITDIKNKLSASLSLFTASHTQNSANKWFYPSTRPVNIHAKPRPPKAKLPHNPNNTQLAAPSISSSSPAPTPTTSSDHRPTVIENYDSSFYRNRTIVAASGTHSPISSSTICSATLTVPLTTTSSPQISSLISTAASSNVLTQSQHTSLAALLKTPINSTHTSQSEQLPPTIPSPLARSSDESPEDERTLSTPRPQHSSSLNSRTAFGGGIALAGIAAIAHYGDLWLMLKNIPHSIRKKIKELRDGTNERNALQQACAERDGCQQTPHAWVYSTIGE